MIKGFVGGSVFVFLLWEYAEHSCTEDLNIGVRALVGINSTPLYLTSCVGVIFSNGDLPSVCGE